MHVIGVSGGGHIKVIIKEKVYKKGKLMKTIAHKSRKLGEPKVEWAQRKPLKALCNQITQILQWYKENIKTSQRNTIHIGEQR